MSRPVLRVGYYRFRTTFGRRWGGYLMVVVLIGLIGGIAMGSMAAARRTQSSFPSFLAATNPSQVSVGTAVYSSAVGALFGYPTFADQIARLPHVTRVESAALLDVVPYLGPNGAPGPDFGPAAGDPTGLDTIGSINGLYFNEDRVVITKGRMANPANPHEMVVQASQAQGVRVGQVIAFGVYTNAQENRPGFSTASPPYRRIDVKVVGLGVSNDGVVADSADTGGSFAVLFTPAFTESLVSCCARAVPDTAIQVGGGSRGVAAVEAEIGRTSPAAAGPPSFYLSSATEAKAERAIRPEAIALGVFAAIAGLAVLVITSQVIGRQLRLDADELHVLRALGAPPSMTASAGLVGIVGSVVIGAVLAVAVAVGLSPLAPVGVVRPVYPDPGIAFDWTVLVLGFAVLTAVLSGVAAATAYRQAPHRIADRQRQAPAGGSGLALAAARLGLPAPAVVGIRFAVDPGAGRTTVPARSVIVGVSLAVVVLTATLTFGASLANLVAQPSLYGWNWNYELIAGGGSGDIPQRQASQLLDHDSAVTAWSGVYFATLTLDGDVVPVLGASPAAAVAPPILSGHPLDAPDQVVLGALTLAQLHKHVGDTVIESNRVTAPAVLRIVGTAAMPVIGNNDHLTLGTGALLSSTLISAFDRNTGTDRVTGPNAILVRVRHGVLQGSLQPIANATSTTDNGGVSVNAVQRPAEIVNYRSMGTAPDLLGAALATGAAAALGLMLIASVRRRRRDLALLKTLGFTRRQLAATIAWQSTIAVALGTAVGIPLGIALGRWLWILFARDIDVVPAPTVPLPSIVLIAVGAILLANLVAAIPGLNATRTKTAVLLRAE
jgi:FtsX-like permease family